MAFDIKSLFVAAATSCTAPCANAASHGVLEGNQQFQCTYGSYRMNFIRWEFDESDQLIVGALMHQSEVNRNVNNGFCGDRFVPLLPKEYLAAIDNRIAAYNSCQAREWQLASAPQNWPADLQILKSEGVILSDIAQIISEGKFVSKISPAAGESFNSVEEAAGGIGKLKDVAELAQLLVAGGKALHHELENTSEIASDQIKESEGDLMKGLKSPSEVQGNAIRYAMEKIYVQPMIKYNISFSHSICD